MGSYYDVDAILTDAQVDIHTYYSHCHTDMLKKVPCTFDISVPGLGYLEGNAGQEVTGKANLLRIRVDTTWTDQGRHESGASAMAC